MNAVTKRALCVGAAAVMSLSASSCELIDYDIIEEQHTAVSRPVVIDFSWWGNEERSDYTVRGINEYERKEQNLDIRPMVSDFTGYKENLDALFACKKEPDIMMINSAWLPEYSPDGEGFCDLSLYADEIALSNFSDTELSYGTVNGNLNALPVSLNAMSFYYNRQLLNKYGLSVPETWDDLFHCAEVLAPDGIFTLESSDRHYWKMLIAHEEQYTGREAFGENGFINVDVISMMTFYKQLIEKRVVPMKDFDRNDFLGGRTAGVMLWVSDAQYYVTPIEESGGEAIVGGYPHMAMNKRFGWYVKPTSLYAISRNSQNPREAARFLNYLMNDSHMAELQGTEKGVPLSRSALETLEGNNMLMGVPYQASQMIDQNAGLLKLMAPEMEDLDRVSCFFEYFDMFYYGQMAVDEAAEEFLRQYPFTGSSGGGRQ